MPSCISPVYKKLTCYLINRRSSAFSSFGRVIPTNVSQVDVCAFWHSMLDAQNARLSWEIHHISNYTCLLKRRAVLPAPYLLLLLLKLPYSPKEVLIPVKCYYVTNFYVVLKGAVYLVSVTPCYCQILFHFSTDVRGPMTGIILQPWHCREMDTSLIMDSWKWSRSHLFGKFIIITDFSPSCGLSTCIMFYWR